MSCILATLYMRYRLEYVTLSFVANHFIYNLKKKYIVVGMEIYNLFKNYIKIDLGQIRNYYALAFSNHLENIIQWPRLDPALH